jgi:hypothetical protein|tara:strand:+ start:499 stop:612 length:114 start_codon:yes stop_codon:yes gene_type:complete
MIIIIRNIEKIFKPKYKDLDAKLWIQKVILKKYLGNN